MNRRDFLQAILAAGVAPAFIGASVLMPVKKLWVPSLSTLDDFETGFWTPTIMGQDGIVYAGSQGVYTRIGDIVHVTGTIRLRS